MNFLYEKEIAAFQRYATERKNSYQFYKHADDIGMTFLSILFKLSLDEDEYVHYR